MSALVPEVIFTPRASGDGTWYVEVASPGIACEDVGDFRSKASAEAWIRDNLRSQAASVQGDSVAYPANVKIAEANADLAECLHSEPAG
jgi:hypothetical protein